MLDTFSMVKEISVMEQRYQAVLAVIANGRGVGEIAAQFGVSRQSVHSWLRRYEDHGLEGLANRSHRPKSSPHQMPAIVEAAVLELRRQHRSWGPRRLVYELLKRGVEPVPVRTGPEPVFQDRSGEEWVTRKVSSAGVVTVSWQQISVGKHRGGRKVDIHVTDELLQIWDGSELLKTVLKADTGGKVRVKKAFTMPLKKS
jgi:transposase